MRYYPPSLPFGCLLFLLAPLRSGECFRASEERMQGMFTLTMEGSRKLRVKGDTLGHHSVQKVSFPTRSPTGALDSRPEYAGLPSRPSLAHRCIATVSSHLLSNRAQILWSIVINGVQPGALRHALAIYNAQPTRYIDALSSVEETAARRSDTTRWPRPVSREILLEDLV